MITQVFHSLSLFLDQKTSQHLPRSHIDSHPFAQAGAGQVGSAELAKWKEMMDQGTWRQTPALLIISRVSRDWPFGHLAITHSPCSCVELIILCFPQRDRAMVRLLFWTLFGVSLGLPQMPLEKLWRSTWEDVNGYHHISSMVIRCLLSSMGHNGLKRYIIRDQPFAAITRGTGKGPKHLEVHDDLTDVSDPRTHVFPKAFARHHLRGGLSNRVWLSLCVISSFPSSCPIRCFTAAKECQHKQLYYECLIAEGLPP